MSIAPLMLMLVASASAADIVVTTSSGDPEWIVAQYDTLTVATGDNIVFKYTPSHDVSDFPSKSDYDRCDFSGSTQVGDNDEGGDDGKKLAMLEEGTFYYACTVGNHCTNGQKITVVVSADGAVADEDSSGVSAAAATAGLVAVLAALLY